MTAGRKGSAEGPDSHARGRSGPRRPIEATATWEVTLPWAVAFLKKSEDPPALLVAALTRTQVDRGVLLELYSKQVLEAKKLLTDFALNAWAPALAQSSQEDFAQLLPTALRMMPLRARLRESKANSSGNGSPRRARCHSRPWWAVPHDFLWKIDP